MTAEKVFNIAALIVGVALVTTIVARPNSVAVIREIASGFSGAISAALGKGVSFS